MASSYSGLRTPARSHRCTVGIRYHKCPSKVVIETLESRELQRGGNMKLARFRVNDWESYGIVERDRVSVIQGDIFGEYKVTQASYQWHE